MTETNDIGLIGEGEELTPEQAKERIDSIGLKPQTRAALFDNQDPAHEAVRKQWSRLHEIAAGGEGKPEEEPVDHALTDGPPPSPDDYEFEHHEGEWNSELEQNARQWFHEAGLPVTTGKIISHLWNERAPKPPSEDEMFAEAERTGAKLRAEWGDEFEAKVQKAWAYAEQVSPDAMKNMQAVGLDVNEITMRALVRAAEAKGD